MPTPSGRKIEDGLKRLLVARRNRPISAPEASDQLVDEFDLDPVLKGSTKSVWFLACQKARGNLVKAGVINQFPEDLWSFTDSHWKEIQGADRDANRT